MVKESFGEIRSVVCESCGWEMVYTVPEEEELVVTRVANHVKKRHFGAKVGTDPGEIRFKFERH